jgi:hypothetical protein
VLDAACARRGWHGDAGEFGHEQRERALEDDRWIPVGNRVPQ